MSSSLETSQICRTCKSRTENMTSIFNTHEFEPPAEIKICEVISLCASVQIHKGDGLPEQVCTGCIENIKKAFAFRKLCEESDAALRCSLKVNCLMTNVKEEADEDLAEFTSFEVGSGGGDAAGAELNRSEAFFRSIKQEIVNNEAVKYNDFEVKCPDNDATNTNQSEDDLMESDTNSEVLDNIDESNKEKRGRKEHKLHSCDTCGKTFSRRYALKLHSVVHSNEKQHKCDVCGRVFAYRAGLLAHKRFHTGMKPFKCTVCDKRFAQSTNCKIHVRKHENGKLFTCDVCNKAYPNSKYFAVHVGLTHRNGDGEKRGVEKLYNCRRCDAVHDSLEDYEKHLVDEHDESLEDVNSSDVGDIVAPDKLPNCEEEKPCPICKSTLITSNFPKHMTAHSIDQPLACRLCGVTSRTKNKLMDHLLTHVGNTDKKSLLCSMCGKRFSHSYNLKKHMNTHTGAKPHVCETCGRGFADRANLKVHNRIHTNEKPYKCDICGQSFRQGGDRNMHVKKRHLGKVHECTLCDTVYVKSESLVYHMRSKHTFERPFKCDRCSMSFVSRMSLREHSMTHTGARPFMCSVCGTAFRRSGYLKKHMKQHDTETELA